MGVRKWSCIAAMSLAALFVAFGCSKRDGATGPLVVKLAHYYPETHPQHIALRDVFKQQVETESEGRIRVEIYPNNQLGAEKEFTEGVKMGTIEMALLGVMLSDQFPELKVMEFPYLFDNPEEGFRILNGPVGEEVSRGLTQIGLRSLCYTINGVRVVSNSVHPIQTLEDCRYIKLRVPQVAHFVEMGRALGFNVVTMPMSEIFTALQQDVIDGQENPPTTLLTTGWYEVQKYVALTRHIVSFNNLVINERVYQRMSPAQKGLVSRAADAYARRELELYVAAEQNDIERLKGYGLEFTSPDLAPFKAAVAPVYDKFCGKDSKLGVVVEQIRTQQIQ